MNPVVGGILAALAIAGAVIAAAAKPAASLGHNPARCEPRTPLSEIRRCLQHCVDQRVSCAPCRKHFAACASSIRSVLTE